jgi:osmotically-inducible protein OsmY
MKIMKTDTQIQEDVLEELKWEPSLHAAGIGVEVNDSVVTLAGHVDSYAQKLAAERAARRVAGVKALAVEIDIKLVGTKTRTDAEIASAATHALSWNIVIPDDRINVTVEKGWITLDGQVDWDYQRQAAMKAVRYLMGVTGVSNQIKLKPTVSVPAVKADIEAALKRRAHDDACAISVTVSGNAVTLTGKVHTWAERELAAYAAWGTRGVYEVHNNIGVL